MGLFLQRFGVLMIRARDWRLWLWLWLWLDGKGEVVGLEGGFYMVDG